MRRRRCEEKEERGTRTANLRASYRRASYLQIEAHRVLGRPVLRPTRLIHEVAPGRVRVAGAEATGHAKVAAAPRPKHGALVGEVRRAFSHKGGQVVRQTAVRAERTVRRGGGDHVGAEPPARGAAAPNRTGPPLVLPLLPLRWRFARARGCRRGEEGGVLRCLLGQENM